MTPEQLIKTVEAFRESKKDYEGLNGFLYNGGVVFTLACTGVATVLGAKGVPENCMWVAPLLTGLATIWVGIDRALQFGQRWILHRTLKATYETLILRLKTIDTLPESERAAELISVRNALIELPGGYRLLPGTSGVTEIKGG